MKHYGDITKLSGYDLPVVDIITGGSPCQDLSVAGKRAGLAGERSGLFMEQMRIVKEMRERDRESGRTAWAVRPRYMVWENVPGAFSSGTPKGADFAAVIEEIIKVVEPGAAVDVCVPERGWTKSGCYYAEDGSWSIAWRVHDAQFWGVPQRRKRIALVADFGGLSAPEILFERNGLRGDSAESGAPGEGAAFGAEAGADSAEPVLLESNQNHATVQTDGISTALPASMGMGGGYVPMVMKGVDLYNQTITGGVTKSLNSAATDSDHILCVLQADTDLVVGSFYPQMKAESQCWRDDGISNTLVNGTNPGFQNGVCYRTGVYENHSQDSRYKPLAAGMHPPTVALSIGNGQLNQMSMAEQANTLDTMHDQQAVLTFDKEMYNCGEKMGGVPQARYDNVAPTVRADSHPSGVVQSIDTSHADSVVRCDGETVPSLQSRQYKGGNNVQTGTVVRRLTPMECERLQGYPDGWIDIGEWTDSKGKRHKDADSQRYKALGNSIALPFWAWMARRICAQYERPMTMASLFDGIGGFPLVFSRAGATPVWASEIEEFPIAVTKIHFPEEESNET